LINYWLIEEPRGINHRAMTLHQFAVPLHTESTTDLDCAVMSYPLLEWTLGSLVLTVQHRMQKSVEEFMDELCGNLVFDALKFGAD
jgi:hypothetical protein